jgi:cytochrome P450
MESARQATHIFSLNRCPRDKSLCLGEYHIGDTDCVAVCGPMLMLQNYAMEIFKEPLKYNPRRFLGSSHESCNQYNVMTWGAGLHLCPGKMFALYEIKMAVALVLLNFKLELHKGSVSALNYFSPSAFAERRVHATVKLADTK